MEPPNYHKVRALIFPETFESTGFVSILWLLDEADDDLGFCVRFTHPFNQAKNIGSGNPKISIDPDLGVCLGGKGVDADVDQVDSGCEKSCRPLLVHDGAVGRQRDIHPGVPDRRFDHVVSIRMNQRFAVAGVSNVLCSFLSVLPDFLDHLFVQRGIEVASSIMFGFLESRVRTMSTGEVADLSNIQENLGRKTRRKSSGEIVSGFAGKGWARVVHNPYGRLEISSARCSVT